MAKYCVEIELLSELSEQSKAAMLHIYLEAASAINVCRQIARLQVDEAITVDDGAVMAFRTE